MLGSGLHHLSTDLKVRLSILYCLLTSRFLPFCLHSGPAWKKRWESIFSLASFTLPVSSSLTVRNSCWVWHFGDQVSLSCGEAGTQVSLLWALWSLGYFAKSPCLDMHQALGDSSGAGAWRQSHIWAFVRGQSSDTALFLASSSQPWAFLISLQSRFTLSVDCRACWCQDNTFWISWFGSHACFL